MDQQYEDERRKYALDLIEYDRKLTLQFAKESEAPAGAETAATDELFELYKEFSLFSRLKCEIRNCCNMTDVRC
jgi:hypothetical protein